MDAKKLLPSREEFPRLALEQVLGELVQRIKHLERQLRDSMRHPRRGLEREEDDELEYWQDFDDEED